MRLALCVAVASTWLYVVTVDLVAQRSAITDQGITATLDAIRDRIGRNEQVLYPTAATVTEIRVELAAIKESIQAGKYLAGVMTAALVGQFFIQIYGSSRPVVKRRRRDEDDSGPVDTSHTRAD